MDEVEEYLASLSEKEKQAYTIAKDHLGTLLDISQSNGFLQWKMDASKFLKCPKQSSDDPFDSKIIKFLQAKKFIDLEEAIKADNFKDYRGTYMQFAQEKTGALGHFIHTGLCFKYDKETLIVKAISGDITTYNLKYISNMCIEVYEEHNKANEVCYYDIGDIPDYLQNEVVPFPPYEKGWPTA